MKPRDVTGSFDELSRLSAETASPAAEKAARRTGGAQPPGEHAPFSGEAAPLTARALALAEEKGALGVPAASAEQLAELSARSDEDAGFLSPIIAEIVRADDDLARGAGVDPAVVGRTMDQGDEMGALRRSAAHLRRCVMDTRRDLAAELRQLGRALVEHVEGRLAPGKGDRVAQEILRSDAAELLASFAALQAGPQAERDKTLAEGQVHEGLLAQEADRATVLRAMLALRSGEALNEEEWDHAAEVYDALSRGTAEKGKERRGRGR